MELCSSSSFTSLPYDTLRHIILYDSVYTMQPDESDEHPLHFHVVSPPIVASQVCRSWRHALLSDSTMWTCISIPDMKPSCIMELLRRSGSSLLNVFIKLKNDRRLGYKGALSTLTAVFMEIHRFKVLHLQINPETFWEPELEPGVLERMIQRALSYLKWPAPKLQTFFVWYLGALRSEAEFLTTLFSNNAPNLKNIHHRLSRDIVDCSSFHKLTELHLALFGLDPIDSGRFLNLLRASPRLNLLRIHNSWDWHRGLAIIKISSRFRVKLSYLQILVLEVNYATELLTLFFKHVTFPSSVKWQITAKHRPKVSRVLRYVPRVPFASLHIEVTDVLALSFQERSVPNYINHFKHNKLVYRYEDFMDLMDFWDPLKELIESLNITHLSFEVDPPNYISPGELFEFDPKFDVILTIIAPISDNLESLTITYKEKDDEEEDDGKDDSSLSYLTEFMPNLGASLALEYSMNTATTDSINSTEDPDLDSSLAPTGWSRPPVNPRLVASTSTAAFPYPRLQELHVELPGALKEIDAVMLCTCVSTRRREGYPVRIFVRCAEVKESAKSILARDVDICVSLAV